MKKRALALCLAVCLALSLAACGQETPADSGSDVDATVDQQPATPLPEETPAVEEEPGETQNADGSTTGDAATPDSMETVQQPEAPAEQPQSQPVQKPVETPVQTPSAPAESTSVDLAAFYETLAGGSDFPAMSPTEGEVLDVFYPGLSAVKTKQCKVYAPMISAVVGEIALVEVESAADVQTVKDIFQSRVDYQVGDDNNPGAAWYPDSIEGWKSGSRIVSNGNYVMLAVMAEGADAIVDSFNALFA